MQEGRNMGALMIVELSSDWERREAIAGPPSLDSSGNIIAGGIKRDDYNVMLEIFHMSQVPFTEDAADDVDQLLEAVKNHIRADRTLGGICTQAGEGRAGIKTSVSRPGLDGKSRTGIVMQVTFEVMTQFVA